MDAITAVELDSTSLFWREVPRQVAEALLRDVRDESRKAVQMAADNYSADQAKEAGPRLRRAGLESALLGLSRFEGVKASSLKSSGSTYAVQIEIGLITLIVARAKDPSQMIARSGYRRAIATRTDQPSFFADEPPTADATFYATVLYGGPSTEVDPRFVVVRFPTKDHAVYREEMIDLMDEFPSVFAGEPAVEEINAAQPLTLRERAADRGAEGSRA